MDKENTAMPVISRAVANAMFRFCMRLAAVNRLDHPAEAEQALMQAIGWASR